MGLILAFPCYPTPLDGTDNRLAALVDMDVFDRDLLLALAAMPVQGFEQRGVRPGEPVSLVQRLAPTLECLIPDHRAPEALHRSAVSRHQRRPSPYSALRHKGNVPGSQHHPSVLIIDPNLRR